MLGLGKAPPPAWRLGVAGTAHPARAAGDAYVARQPAGFGTIGRGPAAIAATGGCGFRGVSYM